VRLMSSFARLPKDRGLLIESINSAAERLFSKLVSFDVNSLGISDYNKRYFGNKLANLISNLQLDAYLLSWSLAKSDLSLDRFVFVDYGGGSGMLSLLAKELSIGTVIYNDIYDVSCHDARIIAKSIGNEADYYVCGDIDDLICFLRVNNISCNAIASFDVLEHIYDVEAFLGKLHILSGGELTVMVASGANTFNPVITRMLMKRQLRAEHEDREEEFGHKERDCPRSYLSVRREIICEYLGSLQIRMEADKIERLARNTRGMIEHDIQRSVDPQAPNHTTNTCDPYTGNWAEHLMDINSLVQILSKTGFSVELLSGYYPGGYKNVVKKLLGKSLNMIIRSFPKQGIRIAPFFAIYGVRG